MAVLIRSVLIANRGEIACRIIRTARRLGIRTIAVYSEADAKALHVELADEAWPIGPAPARESYLDGARMLAAARQSGAESIHPGYGFLAENADFAAACAAAGIIFIGPPAAAIRAMGSKASAKTLMARAGVTLIQGYHGTEQDPAFLAAEAERIGYPVLIKPSEGGGGKGMKIVALPGDFADSLAASRREAQAAFGDDRVLLERYLTRPRHIEVQIFADSIGNIVHLFERDCSIQRRHQKVIEEAPAPGLADGQREAICDAAIAAARAVAYVGAGTVEFIAEGEDFFFMEMNTRLQVEHAVTEAITGIDLVDWQIRIASGETLALRQDEIRYHGHAIEARLYAEDPERDFLPQSGRLHHVAFPSGNGLRVDQGVRSGDMVSIHYDPMLAKLIAHGDDRDSARRRLLAGLDACEIVGIATNRALLRAILAQPDFAAGAIDTGFIASHDMVLAAPTGDRALVLVALFILLEAGRDAVARAASGSDPWSPWATGAGWRLQGNAEQTLTLASAGIATEIAILFRCEGYRFEIGGRCYEASGRLGEDGRLEAAIDSVRASVRLIRRPGLSGERFVLFDRGDEHHITLVDPGETLDPAEVGSGLLTAPMPGRVVRLPITVGQAVAKGSVLIVVEAMKMEHAIRAPRDGIVERIDCRLGDLVEAGVALLALAAAESGAP